MVFVWFSYGRGAATYVVTRCDKDSKNDRVRKSVAAYIEGGHAAALLQPLAIDIIIAEVTIHLHREKMRSHKRQLNRSVRHFVVVECGTLVSLDSGLVTGSFWRAGTRRRREQPGSRIA